jgi:hypothetical protein
MARIAAPHLIEGCHAGPHARCRTLQQSTGQRDDECRASGFAMRSSIKLSMHSCRLWGSHLPKISWQAGRCGTTSRYVLDQLGARAQIAVTLPVHDMACLLSGHCAMAL